MDPKQITSLAKLLKDSGDKVLNSEFKLTLSGQLLRALNDSFSLIVDSNEGIFNNFQVTKPNNSKSDVFRDLQFIHDFIQKTTLLCLNQFLNDDPFDGNIDISKFRNLRKLEIHRIPIQQIFGIKQLRAQLNELICVKSINEISDILTECGGDCSNGFVWNELKTINFSYNMLKNIDDSLEFTSCLQNLNLSHNCIVSVNAIKWLPHLKVLDLSYNQLNHIPNFHVDTLKRLQILILTNNFIEDISGISRFDGLNELDLSENCILDHSALLPLSTLASLRYLNLQGNPLHCHPKHRQATARFLHKNTSTVKFVLDADTLSRYEKSLTGNYENYRPILVNRLSSAARSSGQSTPIRRSNYNTPSSSVNSLTNISIDSRAEKTQEDMSSSIVSQQKKIKVREAIISEESVVSTTPKKGKVSVKLFKEIDGKKDHLETKKQIEDLRKKFGSDWLQRENAHMVKNVIGFESSSPRNQTGKLDSYFALDDPADIDNSLNTPIDKGSLGSTNTSTPQSNVGKYTTVIKNTPSILDKTVDVSSENNNTSLQSNNTMYTTALDDNISPDDNKNSVNDESTILNNIYSQEYEEPMASDPEDNEVTYIVNFETNEEKLFLVISDISIKEKNAMTARTIARWSIGTLESCERVKSNVIQLHFDTIKKDKRERRYVLTDKSCQSLESYLRNILAKRPLSEMNQTLYRCAVCNVQFSRENNKKKVNKEFNCPYCKSAYVIVIKESGKTSPEESEVNQPSGGTSTSTAAIKTKESSSNLQSLTKSDSNSSIALSKDAWRSPIKNKLRSAGSLNESSSCSKIESSCDSNQSVVGSTNSDRDKDAESITQKLDTESDIEILSNPSQSSIEVLDSFSIHSSRKHSEERRLSQCPDLDAINVDSITNIYAPLSTLLTNQETSTHDLMHAKKQNETDTIVNVNIVNAQNVTTQTSADNNNLKKQLLSSLNLTESSSSGSGTDSVCTAFEVRQRASEDHKLDNSATSLKTSDSYMTKLGGLFQSTNLLMKKTPNKVTDSPNKMQPCEPYKYSYSDFSIVDHRLKLYLIQSVFDDDNETLKWLVYGRIYDENEDCNNLVGCNGIFIMSTTKFYIFKITAEESDDPGMWLKKQLSGTIDRVAKVRILPWKVGITFNIKGIGNVHLILKDIQRTDSLLLYLTDNQLPNSCNIIYQVSEKITQNLLKLTNNEPIKILTIFNRCDILFDEDNKMDVLMGALLITNNTLYLTTPNLNWLCDNDNLFINSNVNIYHKQLLSNLIEMDYENDETFKLNFMDEIEDKIEMWRLNFETDVSKDSTLNTINTLWEKIFQVPLLKSK